MQFYRGREIGLNSEYSTSKWELIAKEQDGGGWMEITQRKHQGEKFCLNRPNRILSEGRPG